MPKKSKKEKILADLRRRVHTEQSLTTRIPTLVKEDEDPVFSFRVKKEVITPLHIPPLQQPSELTAIKRDLYKTFILAAMAIAAEVIIYWFRR